MVSVREGWGRGERGRSRGGMAVGARVRLVRAARGSGVDKGGDKGRRKGDGGELRVFAPWTLGDRRGHGRGGRGYFRRGIGREPKLVVHV